MGQCEKNVNKYVDLKTESIETSWDFLLKKLSFKISMLFSWRLE